MKNITARALDFVDYLESDDATRHYKTRIIVTKETTWTPYYAIFLAEPEYAHNSFIKDKLKEDLEDNFPDCTINFNTNLNEIEIIHPKATAYFKKHEKILEEIGMEYAGWSAFLSD